jgi:serine phosphatase RsbU (regulator of sigma subunit)
VRGFALPSKMSTLFSFLLLLLLLIPLGTLLVFTLESFTNRKKIIEQTVFDLHLSQTLELDNFYKNQFLPGYQNLALKCAQKFSADLARELSEEPDVSSLDLEILSRILVDRIIPYMGFQTEQMNLPANEKNLPIRLQVIGFEWAQPKPRDIHEFVTGNLFPASDRQRLLTLGDSQANSEGRQAVSDFLRLYDSYHERVLLRSKFLENIEPEEISQLLREKNLLSTFNRELSNQAGPDEFSKRLSELRVAIERVRKVRFDLVHTIKKTANQEAPAGERSLEELIEDLKVSMGDLAENTSRNSKVSRFLETIAASEGKAMDYEDWLILGMLVDPYEFPIVELLEWKSQNWSLFRGQIAKTLFPKDALFLLGFEEPESYKWVSDREWLALKGLLHMVGQYATNSILSESPDTQRTLQLLGGAQFEQGFKQNFEYKTGPRTLDIFIEFFPDEQFGFLYGIGLSPPPDLLVLGLLTEERLENYYACLVNTNFRVHIGSDFPDSHQTNLKAIAITLEKNFSLLGLEGFQAEFLEADPLVGQLHRGFIKTRYPNAENDPGPTLSSTLSLALYLLGFKTHYQYLRIHQNSIWKRNTKLQVFHSGEDLKQFTAKIDNELSKQERKNLNEWLQAPRLPLKLTLQRNTQSQLATLIPSTVLAGRFYFLTIHKDLVYSGIRDLKIVLLALVLVATLLALGLGTLLTRLLLKPMEKFSSRVRGYIPGRRAESLPISAIWCEISIMNQGFDTMSLEVANQITQMEVIQTLQRDMLDGKKIAHSLPKGLKKTCEMLACPFAVLGFFEGESEQKFAYLASNQPGDNPARLTRKLLNLPTRSNKPSHSWNSLSLEGRTYVGCRIQSRKQSSEVKSEIMEVALRGFFFLDVEEAALFLERWKSFLESFLSEVEILVRKEILDEIKGDNVEGQGIQEDMMPLRAPDTGGLLDFGWTFVAARYMGGDFYDFFEAKDTDTIGVAVADVSSKGIGPALYGASCKAALRRFYYGEESLDALLMKVNEFLLSQGKSELFSTLFLAKINLQTSDLNFTTAGHNKMIYWPADAVEPTLLSAKGVPLGMRNRRGFEQKEIKFQPGDWLVLYTDGIVECQNSRQEFYGLEKLILEIGRLRNQSAQNMINSLMENVSEFRGDAPVGDDSTFVAIHHRQV